MEVENKYLNGKIYKITDNAYSKCYYGSTCAKLCQRMARHRSQYRGFKNGTDHKRCTFELFDEFGVENCKIELVKLFPCSSKIQLEAEEGHYQKSNECINKCIAGNFNALGKNAYNKEYMKKRITDNPEYYKNYYQANKEKYTNNKIIIHCDICDCEIVQRNLKRHYLSPKHINNLPKINIEV